MLYQRQSHIQSERVMLAKIEFSLIILISQKEAFIIRPHSPKLKC